MVTATGGGVRDGGAPPRAARARRPVPPRVGADAGGQAAPGELPRCRTRRLAEPVLTRRSTGWPRARTCRPTRRAAVLAEIMAGNASEAETAAVLIALRTKGETVDELVGLAAHDAPLRHAGARPAATT